MQKDKFLRKKNLATVSNSVIVWDPNIIMKPMPKNHRIKDDTLAQTTKIPKYNLDENMHTQIWHHVMGLNVLTWVGTPCLVDGVTLEG